MATAVAYLADGSSNPVYDGLQSRDVQLAADIASPPGQSFPIEYKLSAILTSTGLRVYYNSATVTLDTAPGGAGLYTAGTLHVEGKFSL
jgi:hypothetical protein